MADIRFTVDEEEVSASISRASLKWLDQQSAITRADLLRDVVFEATNHYAAAVLALREGFHRSRDDGN